MPARKTKRNDGRFAFTLRYVDPITGEKKRAYFYGRTQAEAKAKAESARQRLTLGGPVRDASRTLADWLAEWETTFLEASNRARSTKTMHAGYCRAWIIPTLGHVRLDRLTVADVNRLMLTMRDAGKADATRRNCYTTLRKSLDDAVLSGLLALNPTHKVTQPRARRQEARFLTTEEAARLLTGAEGLRYATVLRFILGTGLRRGEALALRWEDIDLDRAQARVKGSLVRQGGGLVVSDTKTEMSRRTVALSPAIVGLLVRHKATQAAERLRAGNLWEDSGFVFTTATGAAVEPQNLLRTVHVAARKVGLDGVKVHTLRHTYATTALLHGVPLKVVSVNLGHASIQITADVYGHVTDDAARAGADAVAQALGL
jgi:integrase